MRIYLFTLTLLFFSLGCYRQADKPIIRINDEKVHSVATELKAFYDIASLPSYLDGTISAQQSTFDTTWGNDDGFSGNYSYIRKQSDGSLILFDMQGPGVINRIWTPTPTTDTLDFYIDDTLKPVLSVCYMDLFSGKVYPFTGPLCGNQLGGFYCYIPLPFEKSCRIITRGKKEQFHQIQYRLYEKGAKVTSFSPALSDDAKEALKNIGDLWGKENKTAQDFYPGKLTKSSKRVILEPGKSVIVFESGQGGRIFGIELSPSSVFEGSDKNTDIRITWDDEKIPAVYCPVADFFGYAFGSASMSGLLLGSDGNKCYCYLPMPFDKSARIELIRRQTTNESGEPANINAEIWYTSEQRNPVREGKFYASWFKESPTKPGHPHTIADVQGKGHYIGTILQAQGLKAGMTIFFEGDDSTAIDGQFRLHGTGSEDYFNGGWYAMIDRWDDKMSLPLHGSLGYSLPFCRTGAYRFYLSDKLSFEKSFYESIEHGPAGNNVPADYTSLGLYYCGSPAAKTTTPAEVNTTVYIPDTLFLYPQLTDFTIYGGIKIETTWKYGTGGESYLFTPGADSWLRMSLREIPEGSYSLFFDILKSPAGCDFSLWNRQKKLSDEIASYNNKEERVQFLHICDLTLKEANKTLTIRFNPVNEKKSLLLNRIILVRK
jgi:hypothetical protein